MVLRRLVDEHYSIPEDKLGYYGEWGLIIGIENGLEGVVRFLRDRSVTESRMYRGEIMSDGDLVRVFLDIVSNKSNEGNFYVLRRANLSISYFDGTNKEDIDKIKKSATDLGFVKRG